MAYPYGISLPAAGGTAATYGGFPASYAGGGAALNSLLAAMGGSAPSAATAISNSLNPNYATQMTNADTGALNSNIAQWTAILSQLFAPQTEANTLTAQGGGNEAAGFNNQIGSVANLLYNEGANLRLTPAEQAAWAANPNIDPSAYMVQNELSALPGGTPNGTAGSGGLTSAWNALYGPGAIASGNSMSGTGPNSQVVNSYLAQGQANQELGLENNATAYLNNAANTASTAAQLAYANWLSSLNSENMSAFTGALGGIISADAGMAANEQQQQFAPGNNLVAALTSAALNPSAYQPVNSTSTSGTTNATSQAPSAGGGGGSPSGGGGGGGTNNTPTPVTLNTTTKVDPNAGVVPLTKEQQAGLELGNAQSQSTNPTTGYGSSYAPGLPYANTYFPNGDGQYEFQAPTPNPNFNNGYDSQPSYGS